MEREIESRRVTRRDALITGVALVGALAGAASGTGLTRADDGTEPSSSDPDAAWENVEAALHQEGGLEASGVFRIELSRSDLQPSAFGVSLKLDFGFDTEITFEQVGSSGLSDTLMKYELVLLDSEVNPVLTSLFEQNLMPLTQTLTALHTHWLELTPRIKYLHGSSRGDAVQMAGKLYSALTHSATPFNQPPSSIGIFHFDTKRVQQIIGGDAERMNGILTVDVPRKETLVENGIVLKQGMQNTSQFMFQEIGNGLAAGMGEYVLLPSEVDPVARMLRQYQVNVMAVHNHELQIQPNVYYLHSFTKGDPYALAQKFRAGLDRTNSLLQ